MVKGDQSAFLPFKYAQIRIITFNDDFFSDLRYIEDENDSEKEFESEKSDVMYDTIAETQNYIVDKKERKKLSSKRYIEEELYNANH
ncbi:11117_t:CDS:2 [Funneliformis mosseae]|uniref:11117_t:CDS:1 n=1 Tax=Funneliformis mosseae TaxID=27381 RepID=A0A9N8VC60_FUNMO|nr:11117_t:CDS:2 [Funneliformis mosseae]